MDISRTIASKSSGMGELDCGGPEVFCPDQGLNFLHRALGGQGVGLADCLQTGNVSRLGRSYFGGCEAAE